MDNNLNIGYLGPKGTYSYRAAELYSQKLNKIPFNSINEVLGSLKDKSTDLVIVPLENSIQGSIVEVLDFLADEKNNYNIIGELELNINHSIYTLEKYKGNKFSSNGDRVIERMPIKKYKKNCMQSFLLSNN